MVGHHNTEYKYIVDEYFPIFFVNPEPKIVHKSAIAGLLWILED